MCNDQRELLIEELFLQGINVTSKEKITKIKELLVNDEYKNKEVNNKTKTFFLPKLLTASEQLQDILSLILSKIREMRQGRSSS